MNVWLKKTTMAATMLVGLAAAAPAFAANDMFLKIDGIQGESTDAKHKGEIEILSWSWGVTESTRAATGAGTGAGRATFHDLVVHKHIDAASPKLLAAAMKGEHLKSLTLVVRRPGAKDNESIQVKLTDVTVMSVQHSGTPNEATESVTFGFQRIEFQVTPQAGGPPQKVGYDLKQQREV